MYVTGTQYDYERRIHQFCSTSGDADLFHEETALYGEQDVNIQYKWDNEENKRVVGTVYHSFYFPSGFPFFV